MKVLISLLLTIAALDVNAQRRLPNPSNSETQYYAFWPGTWHMEVNGKIDTTLTRFEVQQGINSWAYEETWHMVDAETKDVYRARGFRGWDAKTQSWPYIWMGETGYFQQWEGRKVGDHWYIYHRFNINGDKYLSRQAWIPEKNGTRLMRISEKSYDNGETWQLRFREFYRKIVE